MLVCGLIQHLEHLLLQVCVPPPARWAEAYCPPRKGGTGPTSPGDTTRSTQPPIYQVGKLSIICPAQSLNLHRIENQFWIFWYTEFIGLFYVEFHSQCSYIFVAYLNNWWMVDLCDKITIRETFTLFWYPFSTVFYWMANCCSFLMWFSSALIIHCLSFHDLPFSANV